MPYNMWFLTPERAAEPAKQLIDFVTAFGDGHRAKLADGRGKNWRRIEVACPDGTWGFDLERAAVAGPRSAGATEIGYFRDDLDGVEPAINAAWVAGYLKRVKTVYTFSCSVGFSGDDATFELVQDLIESFREEGPGGILYAEGEGWSNEQGQHLTWEFADDVKGKWWMALRRPAGWTYFQMSLGNRKHRAAFRAGKVPAGVKATDYAD